MSNPDADPDVTPPTAAQRAIAQYARELADLRRKQEELRVMPRHEERADLALEHMVRHGQLSIEMMRKQDRKYFWQVMIAGFARFWTALAGGAAVTAFVFHYFLGKP